MERTREMATRASSLRPRAWHVTNKLLNSQVHMKKVPILADFW